MTKSLINMVLFIVIITIFLFLFLSPDVHGFRTPQQHESSPNSRLFTSPNLQQFKPSREHVVTAELRPIMISPSHVHVINVEDVHLVTPKSQRPIRTDIDTISEPTTKRGFSVGRSSPTGSISASTVFDVPIEYPTGLPNVQRIPSRPGFIFDEIGRKFDSIGEKLCCKIFEEWVYNKFGLTVKVTLHLRPDYLRNPAVKNPTKRNNLELDMIYGRIAIEYNGGQHTQYVASMHKSYEDFLKQVSNDQAKATICKNMGIELIVIDAEVDTIKIDKFGKKKYVRLTEDKREEKIREKLIPLLEKAYININS